MNGLFPGVSVLLVTGNQGPVRPHHLSLQLPGGPPHQGERECLYLSRYLSHLILCPYNILVDPLIRESVSQALVSVP